MSINAPESLQAIIAARLDTLAAEQKSLVQDASVIGRVFWPSAVAAVGATDLETVRGRGSTSLPTASSSARPRLVDARGHRVRVRACVDPRRRLRSDPAARPCGQARRGSPVDRAHGRRAAVRSGGAARPPLRSGARAQSRGRQRGRRRARGVHAPGPDDGGRERDDPGRLARDGLFRRGPRAPARGSSRARERALLQGGGGQGRGSLRGGRTTAIARRSRRSARSAIASARGRASPSSRTSCGSAAPSPSAASASPRRRLDPGVRTPRASTSPPASSFVASARIVVAGRSRRRSTGATVPSSWRPSSRSDGSSREGSATEGSPDASWATPAASTICGGRSASRRATAARASRRSPCSFAPRWNGRPRDRSSRSRPFARAEISPSVAVSWIWACGSTRSVSGRSSTSGRGTSSSRSRTTSSGDRGMRAATTRPGSRSPGSRRSSCGAAGATRPPMRRRNRSCARHTSATPRSWSRPRWPPRSSRSARVAGRTRSAIVEELDRESEVSLDWYRENFLADLVRVCAATDGVPLARRLIDGARVTAQRHDLSLLSARAALEETLGNLESRGRAVRAGGRGLDPVRPPARDRDRAARCEPLPLGARRPR